MAATRPVEVLARAKINLALHVVGRRPDGYHELDSLVVFARIADQLQVVSGDRDQLEIAGPFGHLLPTGVENIVVKALRSARDVLAVAGHDLPPQAMRLTKHLPPASGIGGGSADAAALLRLIADRYPTSLPDLRIAALRLGADVPMCLDGVNARVRGVGEASTDLRIAASMFLLLVNPRVEVSTPAVFSALRHRDNEPLPEPPSGGFSSASSLATYLQCCRNDLMAPAINIAPSIGTALEAVERAAPLVARMSGSGATVFGLFEDPDACRLAAERIAHLHPSWWVHATAVSTGIHDV
nr:4-(cytidine 5'-diphospho)-2-C-methyl-D-erythritol kinase [Aureimonas jatrophae]